MAENEEYNSLSELERDKSKWNLASDLKLLNTLKSITEGISRKILNNSATFDDLTYKTSVCSDKINNLITNLLILTNSKFIENRVYEEDIKEIANFNQSTFKKDDPSNSDQVIIERLKNSIICGINGLSQRSFDIASLNNEETFDRNVLLNSLYKNRFSNRALPFLIGSEEFTKDTFVGLKIEIDSPPIIVLNNTNIENEDDFEDTLKYDPLSSKTAVKSNKGEIDLNSVEIESVSSGPFQNYNNQNIIENSQNANIVTKTTTNEPILNPTVRNSNLFDPDEDDEDDDIFTTKITSNRVQNVSPGFPIFDNKDQDVDISPNKRQQLNQAIVDEIKKKTVLPAKKDFFDFSSDEENGDDLFIKKSLSSSKISTLTSKAPEIDKLTNLNNKNDNSKPTVSQIEERQSSLASKSITSKKLDSIFSSDDEEDVDIFNVKGSKPQVTSAKFSAASNKISAFSSSDDDDDLFSQITKSKSSQLLPQKDFTSNAIPNEKPQETKTIIKPPVEKFVNEKISSISAKAPFMPNVINELNAALKNKITNDESSSSDDEMSNEETRAAPSEAVNEPIVATNVAVPIVQSKSSEPISRLDDTAPRIIDPNDTFNDLLKHKAKLNSKRKRKLPTRKTFTPSNTNLTPSSEPYEIPVYEEPSDDTSKLSSSDLTDALDAMPNDKSKPEPVPSKHHLSEPTPATRDAFLSDSDGDDDDDLFIPKQTVTTAKLEPKSTVASNKVPSNDKSKKISLFDSSDESESDIFSKPISVKLPPSTSMNMSKPQSSTSGTRVSLFDDSDEENLLPTNSRPKAAPPLLDTSTKNTQSSLKITQPEVKKPATLKKSIFDDDSDDDLFKS